MLGHGPNNGDDDDDDDGGRERDDDDGRMDQGEERRCALWFVDMCVCGCVCAEAEKQS